MSSSDNFQAETIEVVPELPFSNDSEEEFSEFSEENGETNSIENTFSVPAGDDDDYDDDNEPFDEYGTKKFICFLFLFLQHKNKNVHFQIIQLFEPYSINKLM